MADIVVLKKYLKQLKRTGGGYYNGYIDTTYTFDQFITELYAAGFSFFIRDSEAVIGDIVFSSGPVSFCGSPFQCLKNTNFECAHSISQFSADKHETTTTTTEPDGPQTKKKCLQLEPRKLDCAATMRTNCVKIYPDYKVVSDDQSHWKQRKEMIDTLKEDLKSGNPPRSVLRYYVAISEAAHHSHSVTPTVLVERLHPKLKLEICRLVQQNITSAATIKILLREFVENMFKNKRKPDESNSGFYPSDKIIRKYINIANNEMVQRETSPSDAVPLNEDLALPAQEIEVVSNDNANSSQEGMYNVSEITYAEGISIFPGTTGAELAQGCREKIQELLNLTYLCTDEGEIEALLQDLTKVSERLEEKVGKLTEDVQTAQPVVCEEEVIIHNVQETPTDQIELVKNNTEVCNFVELPTLSIVENSEESECCYILVPHAI